MYDLGCMLVESRPFMVLDGLPGLYGLKYDSATACGLLLYLCSYKLDGYATRTSYGLTICRCFGLGGPQPTSEFELRAPNLGW